MRLIQRVPTNSRRCPGTSTARCWQPAAGCLRGGGGQYNFPAQHLYRRNRIRSYLRQRPQLKSAVTSALSLISARVTGIASPPASRTADSICRPALRISHSSGQNPHPRRAPARAIKDFSSSGNSRICTSLRSSTALARSGHQLRRIMKSARTRTRWNRHNPFQIFVSRRFAGSSLIQRAHFRRTKTKGFLRPSADVEDDESQAASANKIISANRNKSKISWTLLKKFLTTPQSQ